MCHGFKSQATASLSTYLPNNAWETLGKNQNQRWMNLCALNDSIFRSDRVGFAVDADSWCLVVDAMQIRRTWLSMWRGSWGRKAVGAAPIKCRHAVRIYTSYYSRHGAPIQLCIVLFKSMDQHYANNEDTISIVIFHIYINNQNYSFIRWEESVYRLLPSSLVNGSKHFFPRSIVSINIQMKTDLFVGLCEFSRFFVGLSQSCGQKSKQIGQFCIYFAIHFLCSTTIAS